MVQLTRILERGGADTVVVGRFPFEIGRQAGADLRLEAEGVWERHARLEFQPREGFRLVTRPEAPAWVNGIPAAEGLLRNGDLIELGGLKFRFWLTETRQRGQRVREAVTWVALGLLLAVQVALVYWMTG